MSAVDESSADYNKRGLYRKQNSVSVQHNEVQSVEGGKKNKLRGSLSCSVCGNTHSCIQRRSVACWIDGGRPATSSRSAAEGQTIKSGFYYYYLQALQHVARPGSGGRVQTPALSATPDPPCPPPCPLLLLRTLSLFPVKLLFAFSPVAASA